MTHTYSMEQKTSSVFVVASLEHGELFKQGVKLAQSKGFEVRVTEWKATGRIGATIEFLRSSRATDYAGDLLERGLQAQGFTRPFSISRK